MSKQRSGVLLDVDRSILEDKLLLQENQEPELEDLFPRDPKSSAAPWKLVKPSPGICVKTRTPVGDKVFINICLTAEIPCPKDITEKELIEIWGSDEPTEYRIPMSIGEAHTESDKSGNPSLAYDVAINPEFFKKTEQSKLFLSFLITVVMEGIQNKFEIKLETEDYVVLKNRKVMGELQTHRIRQGSNQQKEKPARPLIEEVSPPLPGKKRPPEYTIRHEAATETTPERLVAKFVLKNVPSAKMLALDIGEDRIVLDTPERQNGYELDIFIPYLVDQENSAAEFDIFSKVLTVTMPVTPSCS